MTTSTPFGALKQVDAGLLSVGYAEAGPADGPAVLLLHGWPYDIHSFAEVTPVLASAGYRVIVPFVRGYGTTRFLSDGTVRNGQQAAVAVDVIALMDALGIQRAILAGFDWGGTVGRHRRGAVAGPLPGPGLGQRVPDRQPGRRRGAAAAGRRAHLVVSVLLRHRARPGRLRHLPARVQQAHLAARLTEVGLRRRHVRAQRGRLRQPRSRRHRDPQLPLAARRGRGESQYDDLERRLADFPAIAVPAITLEGDANGAPHADASAYAAKFSGKYEHRVIEGGVGHNLPQEAPQAFAQAVIDVDAFNR